MNKRGISQIIVMLLLVVLAIAALVAVWITVKVFIEEEGEISTIRARLLTENIDIVSVQIDSLSPLLLNVSIRKNNEKKILNSTEVSIILKPQTFDIFSIIDLSDSMLKNNKMTETKDASKAVVSSLIDPEKENRLGFVAYSTSWIQGASSDLTKDTSQLNALIDTWTPTVQGGTCICCGQLEATARFKSQSAPDKLKTMILMSDGQANFPCVMGPVPNHDGDGDTTDDPQDHTIEAACRAYNDEGIITHALLFGSTTSEETMKKIAACGHGQYFYADIGGLLSTYDSIVQEIKKTGFSSGRSISYIKILFYNETNSHEETIYNLPENIYEVKKYDFDLTGKIDNINKIEIYAVAVTQSGKEVIGPRLDIWKA